MASIPDMHDVFISHVEEDAALALQLALALETHGYRTWCYECDSLPGMSYLLQVADAIRSSHCLLVVISPDACASANKHVSNEIVIAHETAKPFIPVLRGMSQSDWQTQRPEWRAAIGAATSIRSSPTDAARAFERIRDGLNALGIRPLARPAESRLALIQERLREAGDEPAVPPPAPATQRAEPPPASRRHRGAALVRRALGVTLLVVATALAAARWHWRSPATPGPLIVGVMEFEGEQLPADDLWIRSNTRDSLNAILSKVKPSALRVLAKEKIQFLQEKRNLTTIEVAEELGIQKMVSGGISATNSVVTIELRLTDIQTGYLDHEFRRTASKAGLIQLQNEAAADLVEALHIDVSAQETRGLLAKRTNDTLDSYKLLSDTLGGGASADEPTSLRLRPWRFAWVAEAAAAYAQEVPAADQALIGHILEQYRKTLEAKNIDQFAALHIELNDRQRQSLQKYLDIAADLRVQISNVDMVVEGDEALVTFTRTDHFTEKPTARPVELEVRLSILLKRSNGGWQISGVKTLP